MQKWDFLAILFIVFKIEWYQHSSSAFWEVWLMWMFKYVDGAKPGAF